MLNNKQSLTQDEMDTSQCSYFNLYYQAPIGYLILKENELVCRANLAAANMIGVSRNKLLKKPLSDFILTEDLDFYYRECKKLLTDNKPMNCELRFKKKDGASLWVHLTISAFQIDAPDSDPDVNSSALLLVTFIDISKRKHAEETLKKIHKFHAEIEKIGKVGGWEFDIDTKEQIWTEEVYRIHEVDFNFKPTVINGVNFYTPASRPIIERLVQRAVEFGEPFDVELEIISAKGNHRYVHAIGTAELEQRRICGFFQDITERKQNEIYKDMTREVLQILNENGMLPDSIRRVLDVLKTRTGFDAVGIRLQEGEDFPYFVQKGFPINFLLTENTLLEYTADGGVCRDKNGHVSLECTCGLVLSGKTDPSSSLFTECGSFWTNNSSPLLDIPPSDDPRHHPRNQCIHEGYASVALVPIRNMDRIFGLIQFNDRRKGCFSKNTVELMEGVASHIGETMRRKWAEEKLQKKDTEIEQFIYNVCHDLRSPLTTVRSFMGFLKEDIAEFKHEQVAEDLQFIDKAADKMELMLDELLEMSRIGSVETAAIMVPLSEVVANALDSLAGVIKEKNVEILLSDLDFKMFGERRRLCQIWQNLIENAIKYSRDDCFPRIDLGVQKVAGESVFFVRDNGIGIDPDYKRTIFEIFKKLDPNSNGIGLGLSMVQRIVDKYGGKIWVESDGTGKGSCFYFTLPHVIALS